MASWQRTRTNWNFIQRSWPHFKFYSNKIIDICCLWQTFTRWKLRHPKINNRWWKKLQSAASIASLSSLNFLVAWAGLKLPFYCVLPPPSTIKKIQRTTAHSPWTSLSCCSNNVIKWKEFLRYNLEELEEWRERCELMDCWHFLKEIVLDYFIIIWEMVRRCKKKSVRFPFKKYSLECKKRRKKVIKWSLKGRWAQGYEEFNWF